MTAQNEMPTFQEAKERRLLVPLSSLPPAATVLYVSHRWAGPGEADTQDGHAHMQVLFGASTFFLLSLVLAPQLFF